MHNISLLTFWLLPHQYVDFPTISQLSPLCDSPHLYDNLPHVWQPSPLHDNLPTSMTTFSIVWFSYLHDKFQPAKQLSHLYFHSFVHSGYFYSASSSQASTTQRCSRHSTDIVSKFHAEAQQATESEGLAKDPYVAARAGFQPMTLRTIGNESNNNNFLTCTTNTHLYSNLFACSKFSYLCYNFLTCKTLTYIQQQK